MRCPAAHVRLLTPAIALALASATVPALAASGTAAAAATPASNATASSASASAAAAAFSPTDQVMHDALIQRSTRKALGPDLAGLVTDAETGHSDALAMFGHNSICDADPINATCVVDYTINGGGFDDSGSICGITFP